MGEPVVIIFIEHLLNCGQSEYIIQFLTSLQYKDNSDLIGEDTSVSLDAIQRYIKEEPSL